MQRKQLFEFIQKIQKFFESFPLFFVLFVILLIVLGITIGSLLPPRVASILYIFLSILLPIAASAFIGFFAKESTEIKQEYDKKVENLQNFFNQTLTNYAKEKQQLLDQLDLLRNVISNSFKVLCIPKDRINDEIKYLIDNSILIEFFGNFNTQYQSVLNNYKGRIIICDTQPEEDLLSYRNYEYRFLYYKFNFDLLVFHYQNHDRKSMLIFPERNEAWVVNFDLAKNFGLHYEEFPLFYLKEQIRDQIRCAETSSPIIEKAEYRQKKLSSSSMVNEEFSLVLQAVGKGYTKPIFPPTDIDEVIKRWNEKIFITFVDYATQLLKNSKELLITWLIDINYPQTIELCSIFEPWINKLNTGNYKVKRIILIDRHDLLKTINILINGQVYNNYSSVVQYLVNQIILKNLSNSNYVYRFVNISDAGVPVDCKKDFAVFILNNGESVIQTSEVDIEGKLLRLFFKLPKDEDELNQYLNFFDNCFSDSPPSYVYKDLNSALGI
jgi:hypothetical protein